MLSCLSSSMQSWMYLVATYLRGKKSAAFLYLCHDLFFPFVTQYTHSLLIHTSLAYQRAVVSGIQPLSSWSISRIAPGRWTLHIVPPPDAMSGCSLRLTGPGRMKKDMGSPSTVTKRRGEVLDSATSWCLDGMVIVSPGGGEAITDSNYYMLTKKT